MVDEVYFDKAVRMLTASAIVFMLIAVVVAIFVLRDIRFSVISLGFVSLSWGILLYVFTLTDIRLITCIYGYIAEILIFSVTLGVFYMVPRSLLMDFGIFVGFMGFVISSCGMINLAYTVKQIWREKEKQ